MFKNLSIKAKLYVLMSVSILALILVSGKSIYGDITDTCSCSALKDGVVLSTKISALLHETQKERGATAGFLGSKGKKFKQTLSNQRELTNKRIKELKKYLSEVDLSSINRSLANNIKSALADLNNINETRAKVTSLNITTKKAISYYTKMNAKFLNSIADISRASKFPLVTRKLVAYSNFLLSKERAGIERAVGTNTLARGNYGDGMELKFANLISSQNVYMDGFLLYADDKAKEFYKKTLRGDAVEEVNRIRDILLNSSRKKLLISKLKDFSGYGGFIHNYEEYIIKQKPIYFDEALKNYKELKKSIKEYKKQNNISKKENELLFVIDKTFEDYFNNLLKIKNDLDNGNKIITLN